MTRHRATLAVVLLAVTVAAVGTAPTGAASDGGVAPAVAGNDAPTEPSATDETATNRSANVSSRLQQRVAAARSGDDAVGTASSGTTVTVVVEAESGATDAVADRVDRAGGTVVARHDELLEAEMPAAAVSRLADDSAVEFVRTPLTPSTTAVESEGLGPINATWAHERGFTGENVTVAVIDTEGFDLTNPEIGDQVGDYRDFTGRGIGNGTTGQHGTGTAEIVADTAPGAEIVPVRVDSFVQWQNAVDYVREETDTDVVVMSLSWYGVGPLDGTSEMNREISRLRDDGVLWVNSAGNQADGNHWNGTWNDPDGDDWLEFSGDDETLTLTGGSAANVWVNWDDWTRQTDDYDIYVYDDSGNLIGGSTNAQDGASAPPVEIYTDSGLPSTIHLKIERVGASGDTEFDIWFRGNYEPEYWTAQRSLTNPGVGPDVTAVGAVRTSSLGCQRCGAPLEPFSSRGPTIDGRLKPDLVAPDGVSTSTYDTPFYGTSAAAPHAGGVAALLLGADGSLGPDAAEQTLLETATPLSGTEPDDSYGYGLVDAESAIDSLGPLAVVDRTTVDFGRLSLTDTAARTVTVTNDGGQPLNLSEIAVGGRDADAYTITSGGGQHVVAPDGTHDVAVSLDGDRRGYHNATLALAHNGTEGATDVALTGLTAAPDVRATPAGPIAVGSVPLRNESANASIVVENNGTAPLDVTGASLANVSVTGANEFALSPTDPVVLGPDETATYNLTASVTDVGKMSATVELTHNVTDRETVTRSVDATAVDSYPPEITRSHAPATVSRTGTAAIAVEATDESGIDNATVDAQPLGAGTVTLHADSGGWYNATVAVDADNATRGTHRLPIAVTDGQGRTERVDTAPVAVDLTNATLDVESPTNGSDNDTALDVTVTASDDLTGVAGVSLRVDGGAWQPISGSNGAWNRTITGLNDGAHVIAVTATDGAGNTGPTRTRSVTVDTVRPSIAAVTLEESRRVSPDSPLGVAVTATDDRTGVAFVRANGTELASGTDGWSGTVTAASELGRQTIDITAVDAAGNPVSTTVSYRVGRNATLAAVDDTTTADNVTTYQATPEDETLTNVSIDSTADIDGSNVTVGTATRNPTGDRAPADTALAYPQVETTVPDENVTNATLGIRLDRSTLSEAYVPRETVTFWAYDGTDWRRIRGSLRAETPEHYRYDLYTDHFSAFAVAGDSDDTPPTIRSVGPSNGTTVEDTTPTIEASYDDDFAGVDADSVSVTVNGTTVTASANVTSSGLSYTPTLPTGTHSVTVDVADEAGNGQARSWSFTVAEPSVAGGGGGGGGFGGASSGGGVDRDEGVSVTGGASGTSPTVTVDGQRLSEVGFTSRTDLSATVTVTERTGPSVEGPADATFVTGADIEFTFGSSDGVETVRMGVRQSRLDELGATADQLTVYHRNEATGEWDELETTVVREGGTVTVLEAPSAGFSEYAIFAGDSPEPTETPTATPSEQPDTTATPTPIPATGKAQSGTPVPSESERAVTTTSDSGPGFTAIGALIAVLVVALVARRRT